MLYINSLLAAGFFNMSLNELTEEIFDNNAYFAQYPDVANHPVYRNSSNGGWRHWVEFGKKEGRTAKALATGKNVIHKNEPKPTLTPVPGLPHRQLGYNLLKGKGLEIGALHQPAKIPAHCQIEYADANSREDSIKFFPELKIEQLVKVDYLCDLDANGLDIFEDNRFDFVILNHVIEHVANPIKVVEELFRVTKPRGRIVLSAPDKDFTFDRPRALTPFEHLVEEYRNNIKEITDEHYADFIRAFESNFDNLPPEVQAKKLEKVRQRREHAHVWDSQSFGVFLRDTLTLLNIDAEELMVSTGESNYFEYFSVWLKI